MQTENPLQSITRSAIDAGLMRKIDGVPQSWNVEAVVIPFAVFGVPVVGEPVYMPTNNMLDGQNATIRALEVIDDVTGTTTPDGSADLLTAALLSRGIFTFVSNTGEILCEIPLTTLIARLNTGKPCLFNMSEHNWGNCYITFHNVSSLSASNGLWLKVHYNKNLN